MTEQAQTQPQATGKTTADKLLLILRIAAAVGLLVSGYLLYVALTGQAALGCGEGEAGCGKVLASRWSKVLGMPVSGPAAALYLIVLAASLHAGSARPEGERRWAWRILALCGLAAGGSALWFIGLQLIAISEVCRYCMLAHLCSLVIAAAVLIHGPRLIAWLGLALPGTLVALQLAFVPAITGDPTKLIGGLETENWPTLGDPEAEHVVGLLFDYGCWHCRTTHDHLDRAVTRYDGQLAVVLLPTAIDPRINPHVTRASAVSAHSPELARLMLAVWVADPTRAAEFDRFLMQQIPRDTEEGVVPMDIIQGAFRQQAELLVGEDELAAALQDPAIHQRFERSAGVYDQTRNPRGRAGVPRVIIGGVPYPAFETYEQLDQALRHHYPDLVPVDQ
ncbi:MAG: vitamin K epoxide reductase family protein [Planctomycetota bacterium]